MKAIVFIIGLLMCFAGNPFGILVCLIAALLSD